MPSQQRGRFSLKRALGLSTGLHLLLAPFFVASSALLIDFGRSTEAFRVTADQRVGLASVRIVHRTRTAVRPVVQPLATSAPVVIVVNKPLAPRRLVENVATEPRLLPRQASQIRLAAVATPQPTPAPLTTAPRPAGATARSPEPLEASQPNESPEPLASAETNVVQAAAPASARGYDVPPGGWGQNFEKPLVADESALDELRTRFHSSAPISVQVDETGHAVRVTIPDSLPGDARSEIEKKLLAMRYVPAECNGLRCTGTLQLSL